MPHALTQLQATSRIGALAQVPRLNSDGHYKIVRCRSQITSAYNLRQCCMHANSLQLSSKEGIMRASHPSFGRQCITYATAAPATADSQESVTQDQKEFVTLAEELAQTAASIVVKYFRCLPVCRQKCPPWMICPDLASGCCSSYAGHADARVQLHAQTWPTPVSISYSSNLPEIERQLIQPVHT